MPLNNMLATVPYFGVTEVTGNKLLVLKSLVAETLGTLILVMIGCGSCLGGRQADIVRIAFAFGIAVATVAQSIGHVSGCHINPAVTVGLWVGRKIGLVKGVLYIIFQCLGALLGALVLNLLVSSSVRGAEVLGATAINPDLSVGQAFAVEFAITFILVLVVFGAAADELNTPNVKGSAPLAIGLCVTCCHLLAVPLTGSSMNPARSLGPAIVTAQWDNHWVYWAGPLLGGICAAAVYQTFFRVVPTSGTTVISYRSVATMETKTTTSRV